MDHLVGLLPSGPLYFEAAQRSDQSPSVLLAELVREQVLARTREEIPHAVEVEVEDISHPRPDLARIEAVVLTETESQKGILIGARGSMIHAGRPMAPARCATDVSTVTSRSRLSRIAMVSS